MRLDVEKDGLVLSLHVDVEAVGDPAGLGFPRGDQGRPAFLGHAREDRVAVIRFRFISKIHPGIRVGGQPPHEYHDVDVRCLLVVFRTRFYGVEPVSVPRIRPGAGASKAPEGGIGTTRVRRVWITALIVGVPKRTVITAMSRSEAMGNIFTNIDSTLVGD